MSDLVVSVPDSRLREAVGHVPGVEFVEWDMAGPAPRDRFDIVVPPYLFGNEPLRSLAGLDVRLVQWQSIGYNGVAEVLPIDAPFANATTVHEASTAELALALVLAAQRGIPKFVREAEQGRWGEPEPLSLADRRVLLVGYGGVSKAIEARLAGFEVSLTRLARSAREDRNDAGDAVEVHALDELHAKLAEAEVAIVAVPLTPDTERLIDAAALAAMPEGALLVNVARGPVVDTEALVAELRSGRLRAALDVTEPEPLPVDHPLWGLENALVSPHIGGASSAMLPRMARLLRRQIDHLLAGEPPENIVDLS